MGLVLVLGGTAGAEGDGATVSISNQAYAPVIATINPGGTVTWVNNDEETHSVFIEAVGSDHLVLPGATYSYTFGDEGEFTYHCSLHSHAGQILVVAAASTTQPPPPKPAPAVSTTLVATTVAPAVSSTPVPPTVAATTVSTTLVPTTVPPVTTAAPTTTAVTVTQAATDSTLASLGSVGDGGGGGLPSAALIGGGGAGAALGVVAGYLLKRRMSRRAAGVA